LIWSIHRPSLRAMKFLARPVRKILGSKTEESQRRKNRRRCYGSFQRFWMTFYWVIVILSSKQWSSELGKKRKERKKEDLCYGSVVSASELFFMVFCFRFVNPYFSWARRYLIEVRII
jgi:hypothetical protein